MSNNWFLIGFCVALFSCNPGGELGTSTRSNSNAEKSNNNSNLDEDSNSKAQTSKKSPPISDEKKGCGQNALSDPNPTTGQLILSVGENIDPCTVNGYIVGHTDISLERAQNSQYVINNVPAGNSDVIITASSLIAANESLSLAETHPADRGIRIKQAFFSKGLRTDLSEITLPKMGSISGQVKTLEKKDSANVKVTIPGTLINTKTNEVGFYSLKSLPVGEHSLLFEKTGFDSYKIESQFVSEDTQASVDIDLVKSTDGGGAIEGDIGAGGSSGAESGSAGEGSSAGEGPFGGDSSGSAENGNPSPTCSTCNCTQSWCKNHCKKCEPPPTRCELCRRNSCKPTARCDDCNGCRPAQTCQDCKFGEPSCNTIFCLSKCLNKCTS